MANKATEKQRAKLAHLRQDIFKEYSERVKSLESDNFRLKEMVTDLQKEISELKRELLRKDEQLKEFKKSPLAKYITDIESHLPSGCFMELDDIIREAEKSEVVQ